MYTQPLTLTLILTLTLTSTSTLTLTLTLIPTLIPTTMALAKEQEWVIKVRKYSGGINLGETTKDKLAEFIKIEIYIYEKENFLDNTLWTIF